ncbi:MAG: N-formylglutamate amidohydrolase [Sphingomonadales bacterium]
MHATFDIYGKGSRHPVCISVPHAGKSYPDGVAALLAMPLARARGIEDRHADLLAQEAITRSHCTIIARTPRLLIDLNRAENDIVPGTIAGGAVRSARPSYRARGGLGLIPDRLPGVGPLWRQRPDVSTLAERIATVHRPYHAALAAILAAARRRNGYAILIDLHSMPPLSGSHAADIVIGDLHGTSSAPEIVDEAQTLLERHGLRVVRNVPYAGSHILERHSQPANHIHALQIEVDRRLYLDTRLDTPGAGLAGMMNVIADLADALSVRGAPSELAIAAE